VPVTSLSRHPRVTILLARMSNKRKFPYSAFGPQTRQRILQTNNRWARAASLARLAAGGGVAAGIAAYNMRNFRWGAGSLRGTRGRRVTSGRGITNQYDRSRVYRKRRMPRRKKKAWKRFVRKSQAAIDKTLGSYSIVFNDQVTVTATVDTLDQALGQFALYPMKDGTNAWLNDMAGIAAQMNTTFSTHDSTKWGFKSGILDLTIQNVSTDAAESGEGYGLEVDLYEITSSSNWESYGNTPKTLTAIFADGFTNTQNLGTGLSLTQRGVTPWDATQALSVYRIKIWKKTKYFLAYGNTITYQVRDPKSHFIDQQRMEDGNSTNKPGMTRWLLIIAKPTPGVSLGTGGQTTLQVGVTRKYMVKKNETATDAGGWF